MPGLTQSLTSLREKSLSLARRMDWFRGLRAATALSTPLLLADVTGLPHLGWTALGGMEAIVSDAGGPYRSRLARLSLLSLGGALAVFVGTLVGDDLRLALPVTLLFCFAWTYLSVLGQPFSSAGLLVQVIYICGLGDPEPSLREASLRVAFLLAGGCWATILSLLLWPLDPYRPARSAVSSCYESLAAFLETIQKMQRESQLTPLTADDWHRAGILHKGQIRRQLEKAWDAVANVRAESRSETTEGRHLIVLLESADFILERSVALAEHAEAAALPHVADSPESAHCHDAGLDYASLSQLQDASLWLSALLQRRSVRRVAITNADVLRLRAELAKLPASLSNCLAQHNPDASFLAQQVAEIASNLDTAIETAAALRLGAPPPPPLLRRSSRFNLATAIPGPGSPGGASGNAPSDSTRPATGLQSAAEKLAANWRSSSLLFRHAARVALVCGFDVCLIEERHVGHGYWLMMTSLVVLQPHVSGTLRRGLQRIGGTVGGGILAALLAITLHSQLVTGIVLFPLALLSLAFLPVSYSAFAFFLTPTFVLAFLRHSGDWQLAFLRIGNTIAGAAIAIAAMTVLFPSYERERIARYLLASLQANRRYLEALTQSWKTSASDMRTVALARRACGLAHNDMEESLERVLAETWARKTSSETLLAFAAYLHRFSQSITGLASIPGRAAWKQSPEVQTRLAHIHQRLVWLEANLVPSSEAPSDPWPPPHPGEGSEDGAPEDVPSLRQLHRLERQTHVIHRHLLAMRAEPWLNRP